MSPHPYTRDLLTRLLAVLVVFGLLGRPLVRAVHLASHEHTVLDARGGGAHDHAHPHPHPHAHPHANAHEHRHPHAADSTPTAPDRERSPDGDPEHPPHPAVDHAEPASSPATPTGIELPAASATAFVESAQKPLQLLPTSVRRTSATGPPRTDPRTELLATTNLRL